MIKKNSSTKTNLTVNFHGTEIQIIKHNDEPYIPVKQVVEGIGLDWGTQYRKLNSNRDRFSLDKFMISTPKGKRVAIGLPLRKLPGWLMTIQPQKVSNELKPKIIQYQKECDEVLWNHWNGKAKPEPKIAIESKPMPKKKQKPVPQPKARPFKTVVTTFHNSGNMETKEYDEPVMVMPISEFMEWRDMTDKAYNFACKLASKTMEDESWSKLGTKALAAG